MPQGLPRKLRAAFVWQFVVACLAIVLGFAVWTALSREYLAEHWLQDEAHYFWQRQQVGMPVVPPNTRQIHGYFVAAGSRDARGVPTSMQALAPGFHIRTDADDMVLVDDGREGRLYLAVRESELLPIMIWLSLVPLALALLAMGLLSWLTYRITARMVEPINWLSREVGRWDPTKADEPVLPPEPLTGPTAGIEVKRLTTAFHGLRQRLREFVQRERDFTRDASHELRTPLTVIRVATDLMLGDPETTPRAHRSLARIQRAGRDMEAVLDAFLILARESEVAPLREPFEVRDIVHEEVDRIRPLLADKPIELLVIDEGAPRLMAPPHVLKVMLGNLLSNAARFTERGQIELRLAPDRIEVRDTGIGMSPETVAKAFDPFYRADIARQEGKGMGLSIVRRLGERFGWAVSLVSTPEKGTIAVIRFGA
ncbi:MAG: sensor histidine kinase [Lysobacter sp.]